VKRSLVRLRVSGLAIIMVSALSTPLPAADAPPSKTAGLSVRQLADSGQWEIVDGSRPVLRYNYQIVREPAEVKGRVSAANRRYAVDRSDYIHPLYGPRGEVLTDDWVPDHPHHRGIYWAWPEVDWQGHRGDLHALQVVFARPTGKIEHEDGAESARITAENLWRWEDRTPIVREQVTIVAHRRTDAGRAIDLGFRFVAVDADVQVARRGQSHYGGLNLRLAPAKDQQIATFTDPPAAQPRRAWAERSGVPRGGRDAGTVPNFVAGSAARSQKWDCPPRCDVALAILQSPRNPDYPGDWVQYPEISWIQPTFPAAGTRYTISKTRPLELHYRLWIHEGKQPPEAINKLWDAYARDKVTVEMQRKGTLITTNFH
jgi:hypothetical protein